MVSLNAWFGLGKLLDPDDDDDDDDDDDIANLALCFLRKKKGTQKIEDRRKRDEQAVNDN
jgi:hypothetical protein